MGCAELSHLPPWFEQQGWKAVAPQTPMIRVLWKDMRSSGPPHDSISVGLSGAGNVTFILTQCLHITFMTAAKQPVSAQASSQLVLNYITQLFLF